MPPTTMPCQQPPANIAGHHKVDIWATDRTVRHFDACPFVDSVRVRPTVILHRSSSGGGYQPRPVPQIALVRFDGAKYP